MTFDILLAKEGLKLARFTMDLYLNGYDIDIVVGKQTHHNFLKKVPLIFKKALILWFLYLIICV